jgi:hypothetical protein
MFIQIEVNKYIINLLLHATCDKCFAVDSLERLFPNFEYPVIFSASRV